jgi:ribosomal protein S18 acetylase RimI-like enzyme
MRAFVFAEILQATNFESKKKGMIELATIADAKQIEQLLNRAYRGESSRKGWTTEADLIAGDRRTNEATVIEVMNQDGSVILKYSNEQGSIVGTVNLQKHGNRLYLGMFSVSPNEQGGGIGKQLLKAAEEHAQNVECSSIYMSVISVRNELINWYKRNGYVETGDRKPFVEDDLTGKHLQPLEFLILEKFI